MVVKRRKPRNFEHVARTTMERDYGCRVAEECEIKISKTMKKDLFGFADMIGFGPDGWVLMQYTSKSNFSSRKKRILTCENARLMVQWGLATIVLIGFLDESYDSDHRVQVFKKEDFS